METDPFAAFAEGQPPSEAGKPAKIEKNSKTDRAKRKALARVHKPAAVDLPKADKPKKPRKPRQTKEMKLPISMLLEIGSLSEEESGALLSIGAGLQKLPKKSRSKICATLGKIFG